MSGTIPFAQRPEGARLLADARAGLFTAVYVYRLDRLGREALLILSTIHELETLGIQVKSMTEPFDNSDPSGKFLLTILSGVAGLERDTIIQRSVEGSDRLARAGAWLGGIVPYGYHVRGKGQESRLEIAEQAPSPHTPSEAEVIRLIYRWTVEEKKTCQAIADQLNALAIPTAYRRDGRTVRKGTARVATDGLWRPGRIRSILTNSTYKGLHTYGKRTKRPRELIAQTVPAIVSVPLWEKAQQILRDHRRFSRRNAKRFYLLRGLITCDRCGLTYVGVAYPASNGSRKTYYVCNGKHQSRGLYGAGGKKCPSKAVDGDLLERIVWQDVETFLHHPGKVLDLVATYVQSQHGHTQRLQESLVDLDQRLQSLQHEQDRVLYLFRKGRIDEPTLNRQLDEIQQSDRTLREQRASLHTQLEGLASIADDCETIRQEMRRRLQQPLTPGVRRGLVETLVHRLSVQTLLDPSSGKKTTRITIWYRFGLSTTFPGEAGAHAHEPGGDQQAPLPLLTDPRVLSPA